MRRSATPSVLPAPRAAPVEDALRALVARGIAQGVIDRGQGERLAALAAESGSGPAAEDDERLRFVTGFADIFVTMGIVLFLGATRFLATGALGAVAGHALVAALAWGLAEFFSRRRRMALPSIVLLLAFAAAVFATVQFAAFAWLDAVPPLRDGGKPYLLATAAGALLTLGAVLLHYRRFGVPVTVACCTAAGLAALVASALALVPWLEAFLDVLLAAAGLASFALAMRYDLSDPGRVTRASDIAFWLHLLAAPLIVHPILNGMVFGGAPATAGTAAGVLAVVALLSLVALVTDRRAILVSGLLYAGYAVGSLFREMGAVEETPALSVLLLGGFVLLLSVGWHTLRRRLLNFLPARLRRRMPHPVSA